MERQPMTTADIGLLLIRLAIGLTFAAHGAQKAFGWWGGPGPRGWHGAMERMGFQPAPLFAWTSILIELVGGILVAVGFLTPFAAAALVAQSIVIIAQAHWSKGFFNAHGGYEFPLALGLTALAVVLLAAGRLSLDAALGLAWSAELRLALVLVAIVGGVAALAIPRVAARDRGATRADRRNDLRRT
jgi:putative oxidoreductase